MARTTKPKNPLNYQMWEIEKFVTGAIKAKAYSTADPHWSLCDMTAQQFSLYEKNRFPIWLSRIIAGLMQDSNKFN